MNLFVDTGYNIKKDIIWKGWEENKNVTTNNKVKK